MLNRIPPSERGNALATLLIVLAVLWAFGPELWS